MLVFTLIPILAFISYAKATCPAEKDHDWSYNAQLKNGPEYWGENFPKCYGRQQSPVNIITSGVKPDRNLKKLKLNNYDKPITKYNMENNGHSVKLTPLDGVKRTIEVDQATYELNQFHFHWGDRYDRGSEHTIDEKQYVMELHFVHIDEKGRIAVVGVFLQNSLLNNGGFSPITNNLDRILYSGDTIELQEPISLLKLVRNDCSFYRYAGSLTTPGCDEGVTWSLCKDPINIGFLQMDKFRKLYSVAKSDKDISGCKITNNFRPIQPLNERTITSSL